MSDPFLPAENRTGLVYSCPVGQGQCVGVRGNLSIYIGNENNANGRVTSFTTTVKALYPQAISEGRLFDQARKLLVFLMIYFMLSGWTKGSAVLYSPYSTVFSAICAYSTVQVPAK